MAWEDTVRPYQLPSNALAQMAISQYNFASNEPVIIKPGFGGSSNGQLPPVQLGGGSASVKVSSYMDMAAVELAQQVS